MGIRMIKFLKNLFKRKEKYYFASYTFQLSNSINGFGDILIPHNRLNPNMSDLEGIREHLREYFEDNNASIIIVYFTWWEQ